LRWRAAARFRGLRYCAACNLTNSLLRIAGGIAVVLSA